MYNRWVHTDSPNLDVVVMGGGAAGYFAAIACAEENPAARVALLERSSQTLAKVKISGGGRCNVTHACFDPAQLVTFYPRGGSALRSPFSRFQPRDTVTWFESRGVPLKTEGDGRMFPVTDRSQTIMDCLTEQAERTHVKVTTNVMMESIERETTPGAAGFRLVLKSGDSRHADRLILATGSNPHGWEWAQQLGHTLESPVPSLFTFTVKDARLEGLAGISVAQAAMRIEGTSLSQSGALLVTHWGLSGPAVLKLSSWGARWLHDAGYRAGLRVNWLPEIKPAALLQQLRELRQSQSAKVVPGDNPYGLPRRLWVRLTQAAGISAPSRWSQVSNEKLSALAQELQDGLFALNGKGAFKEEFVTCGGVRLDEVNFRTMESKRCPHLYLAGEILDIDGLTGGFNFQSAWTTGWLAGKSAAAG